MSVKISAEAWHESGASGTALLVLLALADNADTDTRKAWPGLDYLARKTRTSRDTVRRALRSLEKSGDVTLVEAGSGRKSSLWLVHPGRGAESSGGSNLPPVAKLCHPRGSEAVPSEPSVEPPTSEEKDLSPQNGNGTTSSSRAVASRTREAEVEALFAYWQTECGHPKAKLSPVRRRKIEGRLMDGRTPEEVITAIQGAAKAAYVGENGVKYDDIELICRSDEKLDLFIARAEAVPAMSASERKLWDGLQRLHEQAESSRAIDGTAEEVEA